MIVVRVVECPFPQFLSWRQLRCSVHFLSWKSRTWSVCSWQAFINVRPEPYTNANPIKLRQSKPTKSHSISSKIESPGLPINHHYCYFVHLYHGRTNSNLLIWYLICMCAAVCRPLENVIATESHNHSPKISCMINVWCVGATIVTCICNR